MDFFVDHLGTFDSVERTPQGGVRLSGKISRSGVLPYSTSAMRKQKTNIVPDDYKGLTVRIYTPPSVIEAALDSLRDAPVTREHPKEMVSAATYKDVSCGTVSGSSLKFDGSHSSGVLVIQDAGLMQDVEDKVRTELSGGYLSLTRWEPGVTPDGKPYEAVRDSIEYNHVAVVKAGRAGASVCLALDSAIIDDQNEVFTMSLRIKGLVVAADSAQTAVDALEGEVSGLKTQVGSLTAELATATSQATKDAIGSAAVQAYKDSVEAEAKKVALGAKREKAQKAFPKKDLKDATEGYIDGLLASLEGNDGGASAISGTDESTEEAKDSKEPAQASAPKKSAREQMLEKNAQAHKPKA